MAAKFETFEGKDGKQYFNLKAANGQVVLSSQGYASAASCKNGMESVKDNGDLEANFESLESKNGKFYFNLKAKNGQVIGKSEMYESAANRDKGIQAVIRAVAGVIEAGG
ncbi:MAG: YegP family protein [Bacteroidia bacterium]|nr:YegP family protein [Bacteroidia bacterium]